MYLLLKPPPTWKQLDLPQANLNIMLEWSNWIIFFIFTEWKAFCMGTEDDMLRIVWCQNANNLIASIYLKINKKQHN